MTIPFIRGLPNGRRGLQEIARSAPIETKARKFIAHDGRFLVEIQPDERVKLMAIIDVDAGAKEVATEYSPNGPELLDAVDRLVEAAAEKIPLGTRARLLVPAPANAD